MVELRHYQIDLVNLAYNAWANVPNVLIVLPTGGGKSYTLAHIINACRESGQLAIVFAHRDTLCEQLSLSLAAMDITHGLLMASPARTHITTSHIQKYGKSFYDDSINPLVVVASVDTFEAQRKKGTLPDYIKSCGLCVIDEAHHVVGTTKAGPANKWGRCVETLLQHSPELKVLGCTATPRRADKKGLGRTSHGIFDEMCIGVSMPWLIQNKSLSSYRVIGTPSSHLVREDAKHARVSASGDYSFKVAESLVDKATITGDVVKTYLQHTGGKVQGITFAASVKHAEKLAKAYRDAGVTAEAVSSYTKPKERKRIIKAYRAGEIMQLTNCALFDEGFDVIGITTCSLVAPTLSLGKYMQQVGRALRMFKGKKEALIFDHVGNVWEHKLPEAFREWTLDAPVKKKKNTESDYQLKECPKCSTVYELPAPGCWSCGWHPVPQEAREYKEVDGELVELTEEQLTELGRELHKVNLSTEAYQQWAMSAAPHRAAAFSMVKKHKAIQDTQAALRLSLHSWWVGNSLVDGPVAREQFSQIFGLSVIEAMTLKTAEAEKLKKRVDKLLAA